MPGRPVAAIVIYSIIGSQSRGHCQPRKAIVAAARSLRTKTPAREALAIFALTT
jgi:hypothetical protein